MGRENRSGSGKDTKSVKLEKKISRFFLENMGSCPVRIERCAVGQGNYVYIIETHGGKYVFRLSEETDAYKDTVYWLEKLADLDIPVPKVLGKGILEGYEYVILSYFEGKDIGLVYGEIKEQDKRNIAREIVGIQKKMEALKLENIPMDWCWKTEIDEMLERARVRIAQNGYFDTAKVEKVYSLAEELQTYFFGIQPIAYLDDVSTKNLLIHKGHISGIVDIDWMGVGDKLTYVALTYMALLNMECDTDYVTYILEEMKLSAIEEKAFLFYTIMYCVDFMGERGMQFMDKRIEVNEKIIDRLNTLYDELILRWYET